MGIHYIYGCIKFEDGCDQASRSYHQNNFFTDRNRERWRERERERKREAQVQVFFFFFLFSLKMTYQASTSTRSYHHNEFDVVWLKSVLLISYVFWISFFFRTLVVNSVSYFFSSCRDFGSTIRELN